MMGFIRPVSKIVNTFAETVADFTGIGRDACFRTASRMCDMLVNDTAELDTMMLEHRIELELNDYVVVMRAKKVGTYENVDVYVNNTNVYGWSFTPTMKAKSREHKA